MPGRRARRRLRSCPTWAPRICAATADRSRRSAGRCSPPRTSRSTWGELVPTRSSPPRPPGTALLVAATRPHTALGLRRRAARAHRPAGGRRPRPRAACPTGASPPASSLVALLAAVRLLVRAGTLARAAAAVLAGVVIATGLVGDDPGEAVALAVSGTTVAVVAAAVWGAPGRLLVPAGLLAVVTRRARARAADGTDGVLLVVAALVAGGGRRPPRGADPPGHRAPPARRRRRRGRPPRRRRRGAAAAPARCSVPAPSSPSPAGTPSRSSRSLPAPTAALEWPRPRRPARARRGRRRGPRRPGDGGDGPAARPPGTGPVRRRSPPSPWRSPWSRLWGWAGVDLDGHRTALVVAVGRRARRSCSSGTPAWRDLRRRARYDHGAARPRDRTMAPPSSPSPSRKPAKAKPAPARRSFLWRFRRSLFLGALLFVGSIAGAGFVLAQVDVPDADPLLQSTFVCAADVAEACGADNAMAKLSGEEDRVSVPLEEMPQIFIDAVLAAEDRQFFSHSGIDPVGIARAIYRDIRGDGVQQGGSTITQQYAKNAFLSSERTITRKLKEAVLAVKLERDLSKQEILERYLNTVYFGRGRLRRRGRVPRLLRHVDPRRQPPPGRLPGRPGAGPGDRRRHQRPRAGDLPPRLGARRHGPDPAPSPARAGRRRPPSPSATWSCPARLATGCPWSRAPTSGATYYVEYVRRLLYEEYGAERRQRRWPARLHRPRPRAAGRGAPRRVGDPRPSPTTPPAPSCRSTTSVGSWRWSAAATSTPPR